MQEILKRKAFLDCIILILETTGQPYGAELLPMGDKEAFPTADTQCLVEANLCYKNSFLHSALRKGSYLSGRTLHSRHILAATIEAVESTK